MRHWQTIEELQDIVEDLPRFTTDLQNFTSRLGLSIAPLDADHISLRCHQNATAERWRRGFEQCGELLSENIINGRPICLFKLHEPVCVAHWQFSVVELPWPGEKRYPHEGWEHIEIVLPGEVETLNARALALLGDEPAWDRGENQRAKRRARAAAQPDAGGDRWQSNGEVSPVEH